MRVVEIKETQVRESLLGPLSAKSGPASDADAGPLRSFIQPG
jgi:hypothetical protein